MVYQMLLKSPTGSSWAHLRASFQWHREYGKEEANKPQPRLPLLKVIFILLFLLASQKMVAVKKIVLTNRNGFVDSL